MNGTVFFDTTILIYAVSEEGTKTAIAESLLADGGWLGVQVLNEFAAVAHRKLAMSWPEVHAALAAIRSLCNPPLPLTAEIHEAGPRLAERYSYNIYDALVIAAALDAGCGTLYSEDMQDGQRIEGLTIRNPFAPRS